MIGSLSIRKHISFIQGNCFGSSWRLKEINSQFNYYSPKMIGEILCLCWKELDVDLTNTKMLTSEECGEVEKRVEGHAEVFIV